MAYNGSGAFSIDTTGNPVQTGTTIDPTVHNTTLTEIATGLSTAICKDGQTTILANLPMNSKKLTGMADGSARSDSATIGNIVDGTGVYVATVGGTANVITLTPSPSITAYAAGQTFRFIASGANTTNVTVNISGLGAKAITKNGTTALAAGDIPSGMMVGITYDGTRFILESPSTAILNATTMGADPVTALGIATKQYVDGTSPIPSGTLMLFQQTAAPTGWTKQVTHNDKALRVVSGTASSGGTRAFSSVFVDHGEDGYVSSHAISIAEMPAHTHGISNSAVGPGGGGSFFAGPGTLTLSTSTGGGGGHLHGLALALQYVDLIIASKN